MWVGEELLSSLLLLFTFAGVVFDPTGSSAFVLLFPYKILMGNINVAHLVVVVLFCFGLFLPCLCQGNSDDATTDVYVVTLRHAPVSHYYGELRREVNGFKDAAAPGRTQFNKPRRYHLTQTQAWFEGFLWGWGF